jgi:hypothetical protein
MPAGPGIAHYSIAAIGVLYPAAADFGPKATVLPDSRDGIFAAVAPTMVALLGLSVALEVSGRSPLISFRAIQPGSRLTGVSPDWWD